jgi:hypothetical protein
MKLTDLHIKSVKPKGKPFKLTDGKGLYLICHNKGGKYWRTVVELQDKAKLYRQRADNLEQFANTNKGDAERKLQAKRNESDERVKIGDLIDTVIYGLRELVKINKKTYTIKFTDGQTTTIDKSF